MTGNSWYPYPAKVGSEGNGVVLRDGPICPDEVKADVGAVEEGNTMSGDFAIDVIEHDEVVLKSPLTNGCLARTSEWD